MEKHTDVRETLTFVRDLAAAKHFALYSARAGAGLQNLLQGPLTAKICSRHSKH